MKTQNEELEMKKVKKDFRRLYKCDCGEIHVSEIWFIRGRRIEKKVKFTDFVG